jgi:hypothetical protein
MLSFTLACSAALPLLQAAFWYREQFFSHNSPVLLRPLCYMLRVCSMFAPEP